VYQALMSFNFDKSDLWIVVGTAAACLVAYMLLNKLSSLGFDAERFWQHFPALSLLFLFVFLIFVALHMIHHQADDGALSWIENLVSQIFSGLTIALGVAKVAQAVNGKNNGDNGTPVPPPLTPPPQLGLCRTPGHNFAHVKTPDCVDWKSQ
jgi:high-affinity Fe2+/Pb2+ permease